MIKQVLLNSGYFIDNTYLDQYVELMNKPFSFTGYFEYHHSIPVSFYNTTNSLTYRQVQKIAEANNSIKIKLKFSDHCLAHWLIYKCCKKQFQVKARNAFLRVTYFKNSKLELLKETLNESLLLEWQEAKECDMQNMPHQKLLTEEELKHNIYLKNKKWQEANREKVNIRSKVWRQKNKDKVYKWNHSEQSKACRDKYRNEHKEEMKKYYQEHKEEIIQRSKALYIKNKSYYQSEEYKAKKRAYYQRKKQQK